MKNLVKIKVFGVGGGGCNAVNEMINSNVQGVEFYAVNTDIQALQVSKAKNKIAIGTLGAGGKFENGRKAALEHYEELEKAVGNTEMIYITCGEGGGTGTGAAPVIAKIAKDKGILTVGIVTKPFYFEGKKRSEQAEEGIKELCDYTDSLIVVSNENLLKQFGNISMVEAFGKVDNILKKGICAITNLITIPSIINLDFADVCSIMRNSGNAVIGIGTGIGDNKMIEASKHAISSSLLEIEPKGAKAGIISIASGGSVSLWDANEAVEYIKKETNPSMETIFGVSIIPELKERVMITVILTGIEKYVKIEPSVKPLEIIEIRKEDEEDIPTFAKVEENTKRFSFFRHFNLF